MEQSEDVRSALSSLIETFGTPRMGSVFTDAISTEPGMLVVGTDPAEWWDNPDDLLRALQQQSAELQGAVATVSHSEGWVEGDIGWGAVKADIVFPGGPAVMMRITAIMARRSDGWKIVQFHGSARLAATAASPAATAGSRRYSLGRDNLPGPVAITGRTDISCRHMGQTGRRIRTRNGADRKGHVPRRRTMIIWGEVLAWQDMQPASPTAVRTVGG